MAGKTMRKTIFKLFCLALLLSVGVPIAAMAQDEPGNGQMQPYDEYQSRPRDEYQPRPHNERQSRPYEEDRSRPYDEDIARPERPLVALEDFTAGNELVADRMRAMLVDVLRRDGRFMLARSGRMETRADVLIDGAVTSYRVSPLRRGQQSADVELSFQLTDAATGEPLGTVTANGSSFGRAGSISDDMGSFPITALGRAGERALRIALPKIAYLIQHPR